MEIEQLNQELFLKINSFAGVEPLRDFIGVALSEYTPYLFIVIEILLYFIFKKKGVAILAFISMVLALAINKIIGLIYFHNRPFVDNLGTLLVSHSADSSFPSDHTTFIFSIAIFLFLTLENRLVGWILLVLALLGGVARVFVGVHYPFDIVGGVIIATISSVVIYKFQNRFQPIINLISKIENKIFKYPKK